LPKICSSGEQFTARPATSKAGLGGEGKWVIPIVFDFFAGRAQGGFMSRQFRIGYEEAIIQKNGFLGNLRAQDVIEFDQPTSPVEKDK
jgi:hypothetical protein